MKHAVFSPVRRLVLASVFLCVAGWAHAAETSPQPEPKPEDVPILETLKAQGKTQGVEFSYDYLGPYEAMDVWLVSGHKIMQMIYVLPDGSAVVGGNLIDRDGDEVGASLQRAFAEKNKEHAFKILARVRGEENVSEGTSANDAPKEAAEGASALDVLWSRMESLGVIRFGAKENAPIVYAVLDPAASASQQAWKILSGWAQDEAVDLRVVPFSIARNQESLMGMAVMMAAKEGAAAQWRAWAEKKTMPAMPKEEALNPEGALRLKMNHDFIQALQLDRLPSLIYRRNAQAPIRLVKGMPKNWNTVKSELGIQ